ncbi:MAG TPA: hypothetical protein VGB14_02805 [Acidimicrobiales bacterium]|jgi:hypothetical protein
MPMSSAKPMKGRMRRAAERLLRRKGGTDDQRQAAQRRLGRRLRTR